MKQWLQRPLSFKDLFDREHDQSAGDGNRQDLHGYPGSFSIELKPKDEQQVGRHQKKPGSHPGNGAHKGGHKRSSQGLDQLPAPVIQLAKYSIRVNAVVVAESYTPLYEKWINSLPDGQVRKKQIEANIPFEARFTKPEEIANMVAFLLSAASSHTTGQLIHVDGGYVHLDRAMRPGH